jgi:hypothetical protein
MPRMAARSMSKDEQTLTRVIQAELIQAEGGESDELSATREKALRYYFAEKRGDEIEGSSQVISTDVADMVNSALAMIVPMLTTDAVVEFEPLGAEDEPQAAMESRALNDLVLDDNLGFLRIQEAVKDALLLKNGCLKWEVEDDEDVTRVPLPEGLPREQLAALLQPRAEGESREIVKGELVVVTRSRQFRLYAVPIEAVCYQAGYVGPFQKIRFFADRCVHTRSELVEKGVPRDVAEALDPHTAATLVRRNRDRNQSEPSDAETRDQDAIECWYVWLLIDLDGDGISERYRVLYTNQRTLLFEPADLIPYALGSPFLNPHRITGESLADHLMTTQDVKTALQRQLLDNVRACNWGRFAYDPSQVNEADVLTPRAGGGIRARNPAQAVMPIVIPDMTEGVLSALQYEDMKRAERGGASLDMLRPDRQVVSETATGTERQMGVREALTSMMAANLSETMLRQAYLIGHELVRRYSQQPLMVKLSGQYMPVDPRQWPKRTRLNVVPGLTPGQRGHVEQALLMHQQLQMAAVQAGGLGQLVDLGAIFNTAVDRLRAAGVPNPERHVVDPSSPQAQQAAQQKQQMDQQSAQAQQQLMERTIGIEEQKVQVTRQNKLDELQVTRTNKVDEIKFDYHELDVKTEAEEATVAMKSVVDLEAERMRGKSNARAAEQARPNGAAGR